MPRRAIGATRDVNGRNNRGARIFNSCGLRVGGKFQLVFSGNSGGPNHARDDAEYTDGGKDGQETIGMYLQGRNYRGLRIVDTRQSALWTHARGLRLAIVLPPVSDPVDKRFCDRHSPSFLHDHSDSAVLPCKSDSDGAQGLGSQQHLGLEYYYSGSCLLAGDLGGEFLYRLKREIAISSGSQHNEHSVPNRAA